MACHVLDIFYQLEETLQDEEKEGNDETMQHALLEEMIWRGSVDFGELSHHPLFSRQVHELCLALADYRVTDQKGDERTLQE